jgi:hypothetical protein
VEEKAPARQTVPTSQPAEETGKITKKENSSSVWYSVQVSAIANSIEPSSANFKGEKNIIRIRVSPWYKYYSGKFGTAGEALDEMNRIRKKYPEAFMVIVENGIPRALKKSELP